MKPPPFDYVVPGTVDEALNHLAEHGDEASILAGGQTLMPLLALRMSAPSVLIDINRIGDLQGVNVGPNDARIGAVTRQNDVLAARDLHDSHPVLIQALSHVGHHQTRNRGTLGGSISLGEPAAEMPATAVALGAVIEARSAGGTREIPAEEFYIGPYTTVLEPDEMVTSIRYPQWPSNTIRIFREVARRPGDFAMVGLVGAIEADGGQIKRAGLAWFGMGPMPLKARQAEQALIGQSTTAVDSAAIADLAVADADPFDDHQATAEYRRTVGRRVFTRALNEGLDVRSAA